MAACGNLQVISQDEDMILFNKPRNLLQTQSRQQIFSRQKFTQL